MLAFPWANHSPYDSFIMQNHLKNISKITERFQQVIFTSLQVARGKKFLALLWVKGWKKPKRKEQPLRGDQSLQAGTVEVNQWWISSINQLILEIVNH